MACRPGPWRDGVWARWPLRAVDGRISALECAL